MTPFNSPHAGRAGRRAGQAVGARRHQAPGIGADELGHEAEGALKRRGSRQEDEEQGAAAPCCDDHGCGLWLLVWSDLLLRMMLGVGGDDPCSLQNDVLLQGGRRRALMPVCASVGKDLMIEHRCDRRALDRSRLNTPKVRMGMRAVRPPRLQRRAAPANKSMEGFGPPPP